MTTSEASADAQPTPEARLAELTQGAIGEVQRVIVGQERMVEQLMVSLIARGHCLL
ncbi:MAG: MoxR family ATPase, partial [Propionibacteriales bacterium]|nr:MoxR family ATPase [Propionibacteriales bacterium]